MKYINKISCLLLIFGLLVSCEDYLDVNKDPDNPLLEDVSPDLMLAASQSVPAGTLAVSMNQLGNLMSGAWGGNVLVFAGPFDDEFRYNVTSEFYDDAWDILMARTVNYTNIINYSSDVDYTNHKAIAKILRAFYFQYLVDLYGDIPYFGKHQYTDLLQVPYDDDALIYADLLEEVNEAVDMIDNNTGATVVGAEDIIYQGNMANWRKFANTLKLRLIVRQSNVISQTDAQAALAGLTSSDFIGNAEAATLNPGYANENDRQNPFYAEFGFNVAGVQQTGNNVVVASEYTITMFDGTNSGTADNRLGRLYRMSNNGGYVGNAQGQLLADLPNGPSVSLSRLGAGLGVDQASAANASMDLNIMTTAESFFLQSEAVTRGYMSGDGLALFNQGIDASFAMLGAGNATSYKNGIASTVGFGYTGSTDQMIEGIITQKWLALSGISGIEGWIEQTRTGYPNAPLSLTQTSGIRPVKLLYPLSELQGNSGNIPVTQTTADAFVKSVFWN